MEQELKKQLNEMQIKLEQLSKDIVKLTVINEHQYEERQSNSIKLEKLTNEFTSAKGGILTLKWLISLFSAGIIAFCSWVVANNNNQQQEISSLNQRVFMLEKEVSDLGNIK